jgi:hypothetical protein
MFQNVAETPTQSHNLLIHILAKAALECSIHQKVHVILSLAMLQLLTPMQVQLNSVPVTGHRPMARVDDIKLEIWSSRGI